MLSGTEIVKRLTGITDLANLDSKPVARLHRAGLTIRVQAIDYKAAYGDKFLVRSVDGGESTWVNAGQLDWSENA